MVDGGKELLDIALQHIAMAAGEVLAAVQRPMGAFAHAVGVGVVDEAALEERLHNIAERMVHHPITKGRGRNQPPLGFVDGEAGIGAGAIGFFGQFGLDLQQILRRIHLEACRRRAAALALAGLAPGPQQVFPIVDLRVEMAVDFAHCSSIPMSDDLPKSEIPSIALRTCLRWPLVRTGGCFNPLLMNKSVFARQRYSVTLSGPTLKRRDPESPARVSVPQAEIPRWRIAKRDVIPVTRSE